MEAKTFMASTATSVEEFHMGDAEISAPRATFSSGELRAPHRAAVLPVGALVPHSSIDRRSRRGVFTRDFASMRTLVFNLERLKPKLELSGDK